MSVPRLWPAVALVLLVAAAAAMASAATLNVGGGTLQGFSFPIAVEGPTLTPVSGPTLPPECAGMTFDDVIVGTEGNDHIAGGDGHQLIFGLGGSDKINGGDGDDCLVGGDDDDNLNAGDGNDVILGGSGNDKLNGGDGDNTIDGGDGSDKCRGGSGDNTISNCEPPPGPTGLTATFHHSMPTVDLTWQPVVDAMYYNLYRGTTGGGPYEGIGSSGATSYADAQVVEGLTYYYVATSVDADGFESGPSNEAQVVTSAAGSASSPVATAAPTEASPTEEPTATATASMGSVSSPTQLACARIDLFERRLEWLPASHADRYVIYHDGPFGNDAFEEIAQVDSPATTYGDVSPSFFHHRWYVASVVGTWESGSSHSVEVHCRPAVYFPGPRRLNGHSHDSQRAVTLTWEPVAGAVSYGVFRAAQSRGPYEMVALAEGAVYEDSAVSDGVTYYYVVVAVDAAGNESDPSPEIAVTYVGPTPSPTPTPTAALTSTPSATPAAEASGGPDMHP